ncbi:hypothetical protein PG984_002852 [Apiospora sp. TS-2023a]
MGSSANPPQLSQTGNHMPVPKKTVGCTGAALGRKPPAIPTAHMQMFCAEYPYQPCYLSDMQSGRPKADTKTSTRQIGPKEDEEEEGCVSARSQATGGQHPSLLSIDMLAAGSAECPRLASILRWNLAAKLPTCEVKDLLLLP